MSFKSISFTAFMYNTEVATGGLGDFPCPLLRFVCFSWCGLCAWWPVMLQENGTRGGIYWDMNEGVFLSDNLPIHNKYVRYMYGIVVKVNSNGNRLVMWLGCKQPLFVYKPPRNGVLTPTIWKPKRDRTALTHRGDQRETTHTHIYISFSCSMFLPLLEVHALCGVLIYMFHPIWFDFKYQPISLTFKPER